MKRPSVEANEGLIQQASVQAVNHPIAQVTKYRQVSTGAIIGASSSETTARSSKATSKRVQISERPSRRPYIQFSKLLRIRPSGLYTDINDINEAGKTSWQAEVSTRVSQQTNLQSSQERSKRAGVNQTSNGPRCYVSTRASIRAIEEECAWAIGIFKARSIKTSRSIEVIVQLSKKLPAWSKGIEASNVATKCPIAS